MRMPLWGGRIGLAKGLIRTLAAVSRAVTLHRGRVRALVNCDGMRPEELYSACRMLDDAGVRLVQGGSWRGDRTGLSQIEVMRQALPRAVQLKWTNPVRSVEVMLICIAEGVGRFNADVTTLLAAADRRSHLAPLMVPVPTLDYERRTRPNAGPQTHPTF